MNQSIQPENCRNLITTDGAGAKVTLQIRRDNKVENVSVNLGELPGDVAAAGEHGTLGAGVPGTVHGLTVNPLTPALRDKYEIPKDVNSGVVITGVEPRSKAAWAGVRPGDVVLEVNRKPVTSVDQFKTEWNRKKNQALLLVQRGDSTVFIAIQG